jgi:hypothetical protein
MHCEQVFAIWCASIEHRDSSPISTSGKSEQHIPQYSPFPVPTALVLDTDALFLQPLQMMKIGRRRLSKYGEQ